MMYKSMFKKEAGNFLLLFFAFPPPVKLSDIISTVIK